MRWNHECPIERILTNLRLDISFRYALDNRELRISHHEFSQSRCKISTNERDLDFFAFRNTLLPLRHFEHQREQYWNECQRNDDHREDGTLVPKYVRKLFLEDRRRTSHSSAPPTILMNSSS